MSERIEIGLMERPEQALQSVLSGDLSAVPTAMMAPENLTPGERDAFLKKMGLWESPYAPVYKTLLNPAMIVSLALSFVFPIPTAKNLFRISERVGGLTARFPILGRLLSMQALFRGTEVPDALGDILRKVDAFRSKYQARMGQAFADFAKVTGRLPNRRDQVMVASWLDGLHKPLKGFEGKAQGLYPMWDPINRKKIYLKGVGVLMPGLERAMTPAHKSLARESRLIFDEMWGEIFGTEMSRKQVLQAVKRLEGHGFKDDFLNMLKGMVENPARIEDYFPHRVVQTPADIQQMVRAMTSRGKRAYQAAAAKRMTTWVGPEARKREGHMVPSFEDLGLVDDLVDKEQYSRLQEIVRQKILAGVRYQTKGGHYLPGHLKQLEGMGLQEMLEGFTDVLGTKEASLFAESLPELMPLQYDLRMAPVFSSYTHTMAMTSGWTVGEGGMRMMDALTTLEGIGVAGGPGAARAKIRAEMLRNTYIPIALGRGTYMQNLRAQAWEQGMLETLGAIQDPKVRRMLGPKVSKMMEEALSDTRGAFSISNLMRKTSAYFYLSTLGMNPGSALKNLLQLVLTTGPTIGYKTTAEGLARVFQKSHKYFALRLGARKLSHEMALREAFPAFAKTGLVAAPVVDEIVLNTMKNASAIADLPGVKGAASLSEKISRAMMSLFSASENVVRLATFEGGMLHATRAGLVGDEAINFSRKLVEQTQFLTGPQNTPYFALHLPAPLRQLTQFPARLLEFVASTSLTLGGESKNVLGYNPGTLARMVAGSVIAMELGDMVGVNLRAGLLQGAMPGFTSGKVLSPLPVIPPVVQVGASAFESLAAQDPEEFRRSLPLLVPGGVQAARTVGLIPLETPVIGEAARKAAQALRRTYVDYQRPTPDGRYAVYTGKGSLRGYLRPWDLLMMGIGMQSRDAEKERQTLAFLVRQRDQIREYRSRWLDARLRNDASEANRLAQEFRQRYNYDLPVTPKDLENLKMRREITRIEQVIQTLPPGPARDQMVQYVSRVLGAQGTRLLGIEPSMLGEPISVRRGARFQPGYGQRMGPLDSVPVSSIGRAPYPSFNSFGMQ